VCGNQPYRISAPISPRRVLTIREHSELHRRFVGSQSAFMTALW
jgi:hypothetical protein